MHSISTLEDYKFLVSNYEWIVFLYVKDEKSKFWLDATIIGFDVYPSENDIAQNILQLHKNNELLFSLDRHKVFKPMDKHKALMLLSPRGVYH